MREILNDPPIPSNRIDLAHSNANMYGCQPCPKCNSRYRYQRQDKVIVCDDCGFAHKAEEE